MRRFHPWALLFVFILLSLYGVARFSHRTLAQEVINAPPNEATTTNEEREEAADSQASSSNLAESEQQNTGRLCRYGVNVTSRNAPLTDFDSAALRLGWYLDYYASTSHFSTGGVEYVPIIRLSQNGNEYAYAPSGSQLLQSIAANPGANWLIGNEPDRRGTSQDNVDPAVYAAAYHELYFLIKGEDPTARVFAGTIVQPTPLRLQYLDMVLDSYRHSFGAPMPVDGWSIHNFILNEVSCTHDPTNCWGADVPPGIDVPFGEVLSIEDSDNFDLFVERILRFRQWMRQRGYAGKPLYLTEYGVLMPPDFGFDAARVNAFMNKTFDFMESATDPVLGYPQDNYRLVQRWSWYSTTDNVYNGWLFDPGSGALTAIGQNFAAYTANLASTNDLFPHRIYSNPLAPFSEGGVQTIHLRTEIANSGSAVAAGTPVVVRFYKGNPAAGGTQIGSDKLVQVPGCGSHVVVQVTWPNVAPGTYSIYVTVDPANALPETNESNNVAQTTILIATERTFLPAAMR